MSGSPRKSLVGRAIEGIRNKVSGSPTQKRPPAPSIGGRSDADQRAPVDGPGGMCGVFRLYDAVGRDGAPVTVFQAQGAAGAGDDERSPTSAELDYSWTGTFTINSPTLLASGFAPSGGSSPAVPNTAQPSAGPPAPYDVFTQQVKDALGAPAELRGPSQLATEAVARVRQLRHPSVLRYVTSLRSRKDIIFTTQRARTLRAVLHSRPVSLDELCAGVMSVAAGLHFLHTECSLAFNNVTVDGIFVTQRPERWVLGDFSFACSRSAEDLCRHSIARQQVVTPEDVFGVPEEDTQQQRPGWARRADLATRDVYSLGVLIDRVLRHIAAPGQPPEPALGRVMMLREKLIGILTKSFSTDDLLQSRSPTNSPRIGKRLGPGEFMKTPAPLTITLPIEDAEKGLGMHCLQVSGYSGDKHLAVQRTTPGSAAEVVGMQRGWILRHVEGQPCGTIQELRELVTAARAKGQKELVLECLPLEFAGDEEEDAEEGEADLWAPMPPQIPGISAPAAAAEAPPPAQGTPEFAVLGCGAAPAAPAVPAKMHVDPAAASMPEGAWSMATAPEVRAPPERSGTGSSDAWSMDDGQDTPPLEVEVQRPPPNEQAARQPPAAAPSSGAGSALPSVPSAAGGLSTVAASSANILRDSQARHFEDVVADRGLEALLGEVADEIQWLQESMLPDRVSFIAAPPDAISMVLGGSHPAEAGAAEGLALWALGALHRSPPQRPSLRGLTHIDGVCCTSPYARAVSFIAERRLVVSPEERKAEYALAARGVRQFRPRDLYNGLVPLLLQTGALADDEAEAELLLPLLRAPPGCEALQPPPGSTTKSRWRVSTPTATGSSPRRGTLVSAFAGRTPSDSRLGSPAHKPGPDGWLPPEEWMAQVLPWLRDTLRSGALVEPRLRRRLLTHCALYSRALSRDDVADFAAPAAAESLREADAAARAAGAAAVPPLVGALAAAPAAPESGAAAPPPPQPPQELQQLLLGSLHTAATAGPLAAREAAAGAVLRAYAVIPAGWLQWRSAAAHTTKHCAESKDTQLALARAAASAAADGSLSGTDVDALLRPLLTNIAKAGGEAGDCAKRALAALASPPQRAAQDSRR
eukprot:TRINITY_DN3651_c0_g1_i1.p1 TRINITY_DN3651_c0_g1~~TRINITY_DN3651_c0_g1_i1.p1  ORF type:complete len:1124 (+),score=271.27 TRINITY_DN3651_c0_g1_i1:85-3372(+)